MGVTLMQVTKTSEIGFIISWKYFFGLFWIQWIYFWLFISTQFNKLNQYYESNTFIWSHQMDGQIVIQVTVIKWRSWITASLMLSYSMILIWSIHL